ncbi:MAG: hypothetical protein R3C26_19665 [Calditrichia bacterium]
METNDNVAEPLRRWTTGVFQPKIEQQMLADKQPIDALFFHERTSGNHQRRGDGAIQPAIPPGRSTNYQNRVFLLVETHALKDYRTRVTGSIC